MMGTLRIAAARGLIVALTFGMAWGLAAPVEAQSPTLSVVGRDTTKTYTQQALLAHPAARNITVADRVYRRPMTYRAVPMAALLADAKIGADDYVQARGTDNFSISIPGRLFVFDNAAQVEAFLAVEDPAAPWPAIPGKPDKRSTGPFYIVWRLTPPATVSSEYWAYRVAALVVTDSPAKRWPGLAVGADVPAGDPIHAGLDRFVALCMACHRFNGEGEGDQGPDLARPMNPIDYLQLPALKKMIRNPTLLRKWPDQKMPGFDETILSNSDLDAIVAWLSYKARQQR
jgi:mono/diheme cytochrome c family protein